MTFFFSWPLYSVALITYFALNKFAIDWSSCIAFFAIGVVNLFLGLRMKILEYSETLNETFEDYNTNLNLAGKHHEILRKLKEKFESLPSFFKGLFFVPKDIICYRIQRDRLVIKTSTTFFFQSKIRDESKFIENLTIQGILFNHEVLLDENKIENNIFVKVSINDWTYVFLFTLDKNEDRKLVRNFVLRFLQNPLLKVAKIIHYENKLRGERRKILENYKSKFKMLEDTRDILHLVKNKLQPVYTYFDILEREKKNQAQYPGPLDNAKRRISSNLQDIKSRTVPYIDDGLDPYNIDSRTEVSSEKLFSIVKSIFDDEINVDYEIKFDTEEALDRVAKINLDGMFFLLHEIAMNASEHSLRDSTTVHFSFKSNKILINVVNSTKNIRERDQISRLFNKEDVALALERNYRGLTIVKRSLLRLDIKHQLEITDTKFELKLEIKTYESSNI